MKRGWRMRIGCALLCAVLLLAGVPGDWNRIARGEAVPPREDVAAPDLAEAEPGAQGGEFAGGEESAPAQAPGEPPAEGESAGREADAAEASNLPDDAQPSEDAAPQLPEEGAPPADAERSEELAPPEDVEAPQVPRAEDETSQVEDAPGAEEDALAQTVAEWLSGLEAAGLEGDYARALWLYDALIERLERGEAEDALPALAEGSAAPLGYARAYAALLEAAGIECRLVEGDGAAWNLAKLDGAWTHVDACADDAPGCYGTHFGLNDAAMARDHAWSGELPACAETSANYFVRERGYRDFAGRDALRALLREAVESREERIFLFNAGEIPTVEAPLRELLAEVDPSVGATVSEQGCYAAVRLRYAAREDAEASPRAADVRIEFDKQCAAGSEFVAIGVGESMRASVAGGGKASWKIAREDAAYATVNASSGKVSGKLASPGPVTLVATVGGREIEARFYVVTAISKVEFAQGASKLTLGVGERFTLGRILTGYAPASGAEGAFAPNPDDGIVYSFTSNKPGVAQVDKLSGEILAKKPGKATITLKSYNAKSGDKKRKKTIAVTVKEGLGEGGFALLPDSATLARGDALTIQADLNGGYAHLAWPEAGELGAAGISIEVGKDGGEAVIRASESAQVGERFTVTARADRYPEERAASVEIRVVEPYRAGDLAFEAPVKSALGVGESLTLKLKRASGADGIERGGSVTWAVSGPAKISAGKLTAKSLPKGKSSAKVTVTATAFNSRKDGPIVATQTFKIVKAPTKLRCDGSTKLALRLGVGESRTIELKPVGYTGETTGDFYQGVTNGQPDFVGVDASALPGGNLLTLTGEAEGSSTVQVATYNGKRVTLAVQVLPRPERIELLEALLIAAGETLKLSAALTDARGRDAYAELHWPGELLWDDDSTASGLTIAAMDNATVRIKAPKTISPADLGRSITLTVRADGYAQGSAPLEPARCRITLVQAPVGGKSGNMRLSLPAAKMGVGEVATATFGFAEGSNVPEELAQVSVTSGSPAIVGVRADPDRPGAYLLEAKKTSKATITAKALRNGQKVSATVTVAKAPKGVTLEVDGRKNPEAVTMGVGEDFPLSASLTPSGSGGQISWSLAPEGVAEIREDEAGGRSLAALANGSAELTVASYAGTPRTLRIDVRNKPTQLSIDEKLLTDGRIVLGVGATANLGARLDEGSAGKITYEVARFQPVNAQKKLKDMLAIDADGNVTAKAPGTAELRISTYEAAGVAPVEVKLEIRKAPTAIAFDDAFANYFVVLRDGATLNLREHLRFEPEDAAANLSFEISFDEGEEERAYLRIDEDGVVTPLAPGRNTVRVTTHNKKKAAATVWVLTEEELGTAKCIEFDPEPPAYLAAGGSYKPSLYVFPADAQTQIRWTVSDPAVATINASTGKLRQAGHGSVRITATDAVSGLALESGKITVSSEDCCLQMPAHRTKDKATIAANLAQIDAVKRAALLTLENSSAPSKANRKAAINRAFEMYRFAWTPSAKIPYWRAANSEGGHKDFKPGTIYFGMPYTQSNRVHSSLSAYTTASKDGYNYRVTTSNFNQRGRSYPGSDCSSFASMAVWGYSSGHRNDVTGSIARANYYTTIGWNALQPGDLICKGGSHVVMFLYYTKSDKSQFVVIEQGGGGNDAYSNCVSTSIRNRSYYKGGGYSPRRPNF